MPSNCHFLPYMFHFIVRCNDAIAVCDLPTNSVCSVCSQWTHAGSVTVWFIYIISLAFGDKNIKNERLHFNCIKVTLYAYFCNSVINVAFLQPCISPKTNLLLELFHLCFRRAAVKNNTDRQRAITWW